MTANTHQGKVKPFSCGKTKVYFRAGALESIETTRQDYYAEGAIVLQAWIRSLVVRQRFLDLKHGLILLQSGVRCYLARKSFSMQLRCVVRLQCFTRKCLSVNELVLRRKDRASTAIQTRQVSLASKIFLITVS
jgi:myosin heavy subunit